MPDMMADKMPFFAGMNCVGFLAAARDCAAPSVFGTDLTWDE